MLCEQIHHHRTGFTLFQTRIAKLYNNLLRSCDSLSAICSIISYYYFQFVFFSISDLRKTSAALWSVPALNNTDVVASEKKFENNTKSVLAFSHHLKNSDIVSTYLKFSEDHFAWVYISCHPFRLEDCMFRHSASGLSWCFLYDHENWTRLFPEF